MDEGRRRDGSWDPELLATEAGSTGERHREAGRRHHHPEHRGDGAGDNHRVRGVTRVLRGARRAVSAKLGEEHQRHAGGDEREPADAQPDADVMDGPVARDDVERDGILDARVRDRERPPVLRAEAEAIEPRVDGQRARLGALRDRKPPVPFVGGDDDDALSGRGIESTRRTTPARGGSLSSARASPAAATSASESAATTPARRVPCLGEFGIGPYLPRPTDAAPCGGPVPSLRLYMIRTERILDGGFEDPRGERWRDDRRESLPCDIGIMHLVRDPRSEIEGIVEDLDTKVQA